MWPQDSEADRLMRQEELEAEEKLAEELALAGTAAAADLKEQLAARMKDKGDAFDTMIESEEKIRLGEEGWKARYYQARCRKPYVLCLPEGLLTVDGMPASPPLSVEHARYPCERMRGAYMKPRT